MEISQKPFARVAVITRTKNRPILLPRACESVLAQRYSNYLHVIVNDGGDEAQCEATLAPFRERYGDKLLVVHNKTSLGMEAASNAGIAACDSDYILIHDDDDTLHPDFLHRTVEFLENPLVPEIIPAGVICHTQTIDERIIGTKVEQVATRPFNAWVEEVSLWRMCAGNFYPPISFLFKRIVLDEIGGFNENLPVLGDWDFNLKVVEKYEIGVLKATLANYHHRVTETSSGGAYANTVIGGLDKHRFYGGYIRNQLLREDLQKGKLGLGYIINISMPIDRLIAFSFATEEMGRPFLRALRKAKAFYHSVRGTHKR